ncbi:VCBS repeat-containing protein [Solirubrobacter ginsenosidimutans]|uniref:VCBS repeat-containing protein n=1 Tax=Solirubrobacter ginsenosidimutans TaxID=490573 RepID=A0A9X3S5Q4_9ACTN|nr:VCBS repeat-containing protein [Solirubrobacter ginsenosidimutans]MDA0167039.1 VCBS repeat-containing protein [Solirubrobacter ginsenosidimutans]
MGHIIGSAALALALCTPAFLVPTSAQAYRLVRTAVPLVPSEQTSCLAIADVTGDGHADVVVGVESFAGDSGRLLVFAGDGHGGLGSPTSLDVGAGVQAAATADLTGDGTDDVVLIVGDATVVVDVAGGVPRIHALLASSVSGPRVRVFDVDGDHALDIVARAVGEGWKVFRGDGHGNVRPSRLRLPVEVADMLSNGDFNGDARQDLVALVSNRLDGPLGVLLARGRGRFSPALTIASPPHDGYFNYLFAAADMDRDGDSDVVSTSVVGTGSPWTLGFNRGLGNGRFAARKLAWADDDLLNGLEIGDVDGDSRPDAAIGAQHGSVSPNLFRHAVGWLQGDGQGGFVARSEVWFRPSLGADHSRAGDLDEDGRLDVVSLSRELVVATGLAQLPLVVAAHAPRRARAGATYHLSVTLRTAARVTIRLIDSDQAFDTLARATLAAGDRTLDVRFPERGGLGPGPYILEIHAYRNPVTTSRELPIRVQ